MLESKVLPNFLIRNSCVNQIANFIFNVDRYCDSLIFGNCMKINNKKSIESSKTHLKNKNKTNLVKAYFVGLKNKNILSSVKFFISRFLNFPKTWPSFVYLFYLLIKIMIR